jgi:hypothetical protein
MNYQFRQKIIGPLPAVLVLSIIIPVASFAGFFGDHPHYVQALSDLGYARALIEHGDAPKVMAAEQDAVHELDLSISEIKQAARDDWKPLELHPRVDSKLDRQGRFREALKVLARAHNDICREEDGRAAAGLRNRAVGHLDQSMNYVRQAMSDKEVEGYL